MLGQGANCDPGGDGVTRSRGVAGARLAERREDTTVE